MVVWSEASWKVSRSPLATRTVPPSLFFFRRSGGEKIIRLEARRFRILKTAGGNKFRQHLKLLDHGVIELTATLVSRKFLMPIGRGF